MKNVKSYSVNWTMFMMVGGKTWTEKEIKQLIRLYPNKTNRQLSNIFNRTISSIQHKAVNLKLYKSKKHLFKTKSRVSRGSNAPNWKGGRKINKQGYILMHTPNHPKSVGGYVMEHRLVMEKHIGRLLKNDEVVHHINKNKKDNKIGNLELMINKEHTIMHHKGSKRSKEAKFKMSQVAKKRFENYKNHPSYKDVDPATLIELRKQGKTIKEICKINNICRRTFYNKINKYKEELSNV